ncbi:MAG TPA: hypothetical protein VGW39_00115 [Chthoniobacterales bacterium]|nr:hypothetical protein [Chthoniobacterales bacterium]
MKKPIRAWLVGIAMFAYFVFALYSGRQLNDPSLLGRLLIIGVAVAGLIEACTACYIVLMSADADLGKLAQYRLALTVGLVAGLIFAGLTCAKEIRDEVTKQNAPDATKPNRAMQRTAPRSDA